MAVLLLVLGASPAQLSAGLVRWNNPAGGDWWWILNWDPAMVPTAADDVIIGLNGPYVVDVGALTQTAASVTIANPEAILAVPSNGRLVADTVINDGEIVVNSNRLIRTATLRVTHSLGGTGTIRLNALDSSAIIANIETVPGGTGVLHENGHTIRGAGNVSAAMRNEGTILADEPGRRLTLGTFSDGVSNEGVIRATNDGVLVIERIFNGPGREVVADGGVVSILGYLGGGTLRTAGTGVARAEGRQGIASDLTLDGDLEIPADQDLALIGDVHNRGVILVNSDRGSSTRTAATALFYLSLGGPGRLVLDAMPGNLATATLVSAADPSPMTNATGHTIAGSGTVAAVLTNEGILSPGHELTAIGVFGELRMTGPDKTLAPTSELHVQLGGPPASMRFDRLTGDARLYLGGTIRVEELDGYVPSVGTVFPILRTGGGVIGSFDFAGRPAPAPGTAYRLAVRSDGADLLVTCTADLSADLLLQFDDVLLFLDAYASGSPAADVNGDGVTDFGDVAEFVRAFSLPCG
jgi:hypothetical protein